MVMQRALLAAVTIPSAIGSTTLQLQLLSGDAVCNDGTPSGFYFRAATSAESSGDWLVYMPPHHWCFDESSCAERNATDLDMTSSRNWEKEIAANGIFASGPLADANLVQLGYCTSDLYLGNVGASDATWGWQFRGEQVVRSTFAKLIDTFGLGSSEGQRVVISGSSAGARGAIVWMDHLDDLLWEVDYPVQRLAFLDTPHPFHSTDAFHSTGTTGDYTAANTQAIVEMLSPGINKFMIPGVCDDPAERWKCMYAEFRLPKSVVDYMIVMPRFGHEIESDLGIEDDAYNPDDDVSSLGKEQLQYVERWGDDVLRVLKSVADTRHDSTRVFYSPACYQADVTSATDKFSTGAQGVYTTTQQDALTAFLSGTLDDVTIFEDHCTSFNCGARCDPLTTAPGVLV